MLHFEGLAGGVRRRKPGGFADTPIFLTNSPREGANGGLFHPRQMR